MLRNSFEYLKKIQQLKKTLILLYYLGNQNNEILKIL
jgi:hypothetical protein